MLRPVHQTEWQQADILAHCRAMLEVRRDIKIPAGYTYTCIEDFLLDRAQFFRPAALPRSIKPKPLKYCYANCQRLALSKTWGGKLFYCEGIAAGPIPVSHAWLVDANDLVVDPTWCRDHNTIEGIYYGVILDPLWAPFEGASILDNWQEQYPLLKLPRTEALEGFRPWI